MGGGSKGERAHSEEDAAGEEPRGEEGRFQGARARGARRGGGGRDFLPSRLCRVAARQGQEARSVNHGHCHARKRL